MQEVVVLRVAVCGHFFHKKHCLEGYDDIIVDPPKNLGTLGQRTWSGTVPDELN